MRSEKQNQASKINGAKSKGPVTEAGKANSAANGNTHNLAGLAHLRLLSNECPIEFHNHQLSFIHRYQPVDPVEYDLVQKMTAASWRLRRIEYMEASLLEIEMERQKENVEDEFQLIDGYGRQVLSLFGTTDATAAFNLLLRYAAAARRTYQYTYKILKELQGNRFNKPNLNPVEYMPKQSAPNSEEAKSKETAPNATDTSHTEQPAEAHAINNTSSAPMTPLTTITASVAMRRRRTAITSSDKAGNTPQNEKLQSEPKTMAAGRSFNFEDFEGFENLENNPGRSIAA